MMLKTNLHQRYVGTFGWRKTDVAEALPPSLAFAQSDKQVSVDVDGDGDDLDESNYGEEEDDYEDDDPDMNDSFGVGDD